MSDVLARGVVEIAITAAGGSAMGPHSGAEKLEDVLPDPGGEDRFRREFARLVPEVSLPEGLREATVNDVVRTLRMAIDVNLFTCAATSPPHIVLHPTALGRCPDHGVQLASGSDQDILSALRGDLAGI